MNPSYNQCCFKLILPEYLEYDDHIKIDKLASEQNFNEIICKRTTSFDDK